MQPFDFISIFCKFLEKARKFLAKRMRSAPNILITGTPGTGKSSLAEMLMHSFDGLKHLNISELIKDRKLGDKYNEEWDTWEFDDDKVLDSIENEAAEGGCVIDFHTSEMFPESWIDLVVVLQTDHTILWNRLEARGYSLQKIQENNEAEIMQVVLSEAQESYKEDIIMILPSDSVAQQDENVERIVQWLNNWSATRR